ncbi:MAG: hypothetical protein AB1716_00965 [Planctomycetota bacterium]
MAALKKVRPGDPLVIPATTFNAFVDAARDIADRRNSAQLDPGRDHRQAGIVLVRNESGADRARCEVLGIGDTIVKPSDNADGFKERVALKGVSPGSEHVGRFAVLLEPLAQDAIGRACVDGVCAVKVEMVDEAHVFAEVSPGDPAKLKSGTAGAAALLWIQPPAEREVTGIAWTVAKIGLPTGAASMAAAFAMITSKSGTAPPYRYAAAQATMDEDGAWTQVGGGLAYNNVFNLEEQGAGGQWVNPLVVGDVVLIFAAPDPGVDAFVCTRSHYRGTY